MPSAIPSKRTIGGRANAQYDATPMKIYVKRQTVGAIVWACLIGETGKLVGEPAWILPGETFLGFSYRELVDAAGSPGAIQIAAA